MQGVCGSSSLYARMLCVACRSATAPDNWPTVLASCMPEFKKSEASGSEAIVIGEGERSIAADRHIFWQPGVGRAGSVARRHRSASDQFYGPRRTQDKLSRLSYSRKAIFPFSRILVFISETWSIGTRA